MGRRYGLVVAGVVVAALVVIGAIVFMLGEQSSPTAGRSSTCETSDPELVVSGPSPQLPGATTASPGFKPAPPVKLVDGQVVYRAPAPMRVNDVQRVAVRVAGKSAPPELVCGLPGSGSVTVSPANVGSRLVARLSGPDFLISRVGDDDGLRELALGGFTEWAWDVRPQKSGRLQLDLALYVLREDSGVTAHYRTYAHQVEVEVNVPYSLSKFVKEYGAITGLSVPVIATATWTFVVWLRKKRAKPEDRSTPAPRRGTPRRNGSRPPRSGPPSPKRTR